MMNQVNRRRFLQGTACLIGAAASTGSSTARVSSYNPTIVIEYDDGNSATYDKAFQVHQDEGAPGCAAVPSSIVGNSGKLTASQLRELENNGWEIQSHGEQHRYNREYNLTASAAAGDTKVYVNNNRHGKVAGDLVVISDSSVSEKRAVAGRGSDANGEYVTLESGLANSYSSSGNIEYARETYHDEIGKSMVDLQKYGVSVDTMVWPYGASSKTSRQIAQQYYDGVGIGYGYLGTDDGRQRPEFFLYAMERKYMETDKTTDSELKSWLDDVAANEQLGILGAHPSRDSVPKSRIRDTIQWARARDIQILTLRDALHEFGYSGNEVVEYSVEEISSISAPSTESTEEDSGWFSRFDVFSSDGFIGGFFGGDDEK